MSGVRGGTTTSERPHQRQCAHHGTVWRIQLVGAAQVLEPELGEWECTRYGARWDDHPRPLLPLLTGG